jgi:hypothetical protein
MRVGYSLWISLVLVVSSCNKKSEKVTREQCNAVADHIAEVIITHYSSKPDELWDGMETPHETGIPASVTRETFAAWLATPEGKTWTMQRHGQVRAMTSPRVTPRSNLLRHGRRSSAACRAGGIARGAGAAQSTAR